MIHIIQNLNLNYLLKRLKSNPVQNIITCSYLSIKYYLNITAKICGYMVYLFVTLHINDTSYCMWFSKKY